MTTVLYPARLCIDGRLLWLQARGARLLGLSFAARLKRRFTNHFVRCRTCEKYGDTQTVFYPATNQGVDRPGSGKAWGTLAPEGKAKNGKRH